MNAEIISNLYTEAIERQEDDYTNIGAKYSSFTTRIYVDNMTVYIILYQVKFNTKQKCSSSVVCCRMTDPAGVALGLL